MSVSDGSSEDEAQIKWEEQQIKKAVKLSQVTHAFLTTGNSFLVIGKRVCVEYCHLLPALSLGKFLESYTPVLQGKDY